MPLFGWTILFSINYHGMPETYEDFFNKVSGKGTFSWNVNHGFKTNNNISFVLFIFSSSQPVLIVDHLKDKNFCEENLKKIFFKFLKELIYNKRSSEKWTSNVAYLFTDWKFRLR